MASCDNCSTGGILDGEPTGSLVDGAYFSKCSSNLNPKVTVILLTDSFGLQLKNNQILADNFAEQLKCDVWVPDIFNGRPLFTPEQLAPLPSRVGERISFFSLIRVSLVTITRIPYIIYNRSATVDARINSFIAKLKAEKKYEKIGAVGYCFGGSCAIRLGSKSLVHSLVIAHPGLFSVAELKMINVPASFICAEDDMFMGEAKRKASEAVFAGRKGTQASVEYEFKVYEGTIHGFAARPNLDIAMVKEAYEKAFQQSVEWLKRTLM